MLSANGLAHGTSKSFAEWTIDGADAKLRVNFASHDVFAAVIGLDADGDQKLSGAELAGGSAAFGERTVKASQLSTDGAPCVGGPATVRGIGEPVEEIQVEASFHCPAVIRALELTTHYLPELEPPHVSVATVIAREVTAQHVFAPATPVFKLVLSPPTFGERLRETFGAGLQVGLQPGPLLLGIAIGALSAPLDGTLALALFFLVSVIGGLLFRGAHAALPWAVLTVCFAQAGLLGSGRRVARPLALGLGALSGLALGASVGAGLASGLGAVLPGALLGGFGVLAARWLGPRKRGLGFALAAAALLLLANKVLG